ncbi:MAG: glycosyltransferase family 4 protein [Verrucomicrobiota bacterium]|nr:glycosyltransferase family 4 protein [Verrucomicrobiota bacterium]
MKILALGNCPLDRRLGSGKTRLMWSEGLRALGHEVEVLDASMLSYRPEWRSGKKLRQALGSWLVLRKRDLRDIDLIDFSGDEFWLPTWQLSRSRQRPLLVAHTDGLELLAAERASQYNPPTTWKRRIRESVTSPVYQALSWTAFRKADVFVTLCELDRRFVIQHGLFEADHTEVVPPGVDEEYIAATHGQRRGLRVAYVGSWIERKGVDHLATVMTRVLRRFPEAELEVFGTGGSCDEARAAFPGDVRLRVTVHGWLSNAEAAQRLSCARVFFFPTQYEGFGMALSEAMACGCAVVSTPTGFGAELIHGKEALICDFSDVAGMEHAVASLLNDEAWAAQIAEAGRKRVQQMRWETSVRKLEQAYLRWLAEFKTSSGTA